MGPAAAAAAARQQDEEQLLCSCLGLLDIKLAEGAKLVDLSPAMFRKPNAKAFELVLYHSYCVVKGKAAAKKNLRGLWPLLDKDRKQSKDFYQKIQEWLKDSGRDHSLAAFQRNPAGPKVVSFLCDVAHWALEVQHARMCADDVLEQPVLEDPVLLQTLAEPLTAAAEAHNQLQVERLLQLCQEGAQMQQQAEQTASQLKDLYYELTAQLREVHTQEGAEDAQGRSVRLASVLPAQLDLGTGSNDPAALCSIPGPLQQQLQEVQGLWQQLQGYLQGFEGLRGMVQHLVGTAAHPYAIDAVQLRAYGQAGGIQCTTATPGAALDIAALVEAWLFDVGSVCRYVKTLAGFTANLQQQQDSQQRGWLAIKPGGIGRCSFMSPLVATSDAASHATHLYAQLSLHRACRDGLLGLKAHLGQHTQQAAAQAEALQAQLAPLFEQQMAQAEADAAAAAAAAAQAADMDAAGPQLIGHARQSDAADGPGNSSHGLFAGSQLQLIPPTPMLQQQVVKEQRRQQHRAAELQGHVQPHGHSSQQLPVPLRLQPPTYGSTAAAAAAGAGSVSSVEEPSLSPEAGHSPDLADSPHCSSPLGSASSAERPAAELLMSRELMDLDLVDSEPGELDDGGVFSTQLSTGRGRGPQGGADMGRISFARFSLGTDAFMPFLAAGRAQVAAAAAAAGEGGLMDGAGCSTGGAALGPVLEDTASNSAGGAPGAESHRSADTDAAEEQGDTAAAAAAAAADLQPSGAVGDTPTLDWGQQPPPTAAGGGDGGDAGSGSSAGAVSPSTAQPVGGLDPMAPMSVGSAECLSSAKPRRLTFAAAATSHVSHGSVGCETPLSDTAGSVSISSAASDEEGSEVAEADAAPQQQQQLAASSTLAALRQRFADRQLRTQQ